MTTGITGTQNPPMMNNNNSNFNNPCDCSQNSCPMCSPSQTQMMGSQTQFGSSQISSTSTAIPVCVTTGSDRPLQTCAIQREEKFLAREEVSSHKFARKEEKTAQKLMQKAEKEHAKVERYMLKGNTSGVVKHESREAECISASQVHMRAAQTAAATAMTFRDQQGIKQPPPETLTTSATTISAVTSRPAQ